MAKKLQLKRGTSTNLPQLALAELGYCTDTHELYIGNGLANTLVNAAAISLTSQEKTDLTDSGDCTIHYHSSAATAAQGTKADAALPSSSYTAADVLTKIKTVDGTTSGLDADLLDGQHGSYFAPKATTLAGYGITDAANTSGSSAVDFTTKNLEATGNLLPAASATYDIGSALKRWRSIYVDDLYLSTNTLYLGSTAILGTEAQTVNIHTDPNQSLSIQTSGTGNIDIVSAHGASIATTGMNADVAIQTSGVGSLARVTSVTEVVLTAPLITNTGNVTTSGNQTVGGNLTITGNLIQNGSAFTVNATTVTTHDNIISVNAGEVGDGVTAGKAGLQVDRGSLSDYQMVFDETDDMFKVGQIGQLETIASHNWVASNYASASQGTLAANALPATSYTASDVLSKVKTVDGATSGLDADLLDGQEGSYYAPKATTLSGYGITDAATSSQGTKADAALPSASYTASDILSKVKTVDGSASGLDADLLDGQEGSYYAPKATTLSGYGITDAAPSSHTSDATVHLTSSQNTLIDGITASAAEINHTVGVTSAIQTQINGKQASLGFTAENSANKNAVNGYAGLDSNGKLSTSQLPSISLTDTFVCANQAAMLALTCDVGDLAIRTDLNKSFILKIAGPSTLGNWQELLSPTGSVDSVNGMTGVVTVTNITGSAGTVTGLSVASGKTLTSNNTLTLAGTDGSTLTIGTGGTLGTAAYTASTSYASSAQGSKADAAVVANTAITGATNTKITYDAKGLVTAGDSLSATDIPSLDWGKITTGKPTTLSGYGITDGASSSQGTKADAALPAASYTAADVLAKVLTLDGTGSTLDADKLDGQEGSYYQTALGFTAENSANKNTTNGYAGLTGGKIDASQLPSIAITDTFVCANQAAMLVLTCEVGDLAVRTDLNKTFILQTAGASTLSNWQELLSPTSAVTSVNSMTGAVTVTNITGNAGTVTGLSVVSGKTLNSNNTLTLSGTDNSTLNIGTGGTLGTAAYTASSAYASSTQGTKADAAVVANAAITGATNTKITYDAKGLVTAGASLASTDIPSLDWTKITTGKPTTLSGYGITDAASSAQGTKADAAVVANASITGATNTKITYDAKGLVTAGASLASTDIPSLDWTKITTGKPTTLSGYGITDAASSAQGTLATNALPSASYTAADVLTKIKTVDGTTSGLDADLLDGQEGSYYAPKATTLSGYGITDAAPSSHTSDATVHLTSAQNTWIDAVTATSAEVNYLGGVTSAIQTQLGTKLASSSYTAADVMTKIQTVDGSTSGLDADLLDGQHASAFQTALGFTAENVANKNASNGYAGLVGGKIDAAQLPAIAITDTFVVASQVAMLALTCEVGDIAVRSDLSKSYILKTADPTILANWQELLSPAGGVSSVNTMTGAVTITNIAGNAGTVTGLNVTATKTLSSTNTLTLSGTDGSTLTIGSGGTLGTAAYTSTGTYATAAQGTLATAALPAASYTAADVLSKVKTVDGTGSGLDADLLDGLDSTAFATAAQGTLAAAALPTASYTAADILTKIKTVDGTTSGLDADLLDGLDSTAFATAAQGTLAANALPTASFTDTAVTSKLLTNYTSTTGTLSATDTILTAINKINGNIAAKGTGTVTTASVVTANGISGSVATATSTPAITLTLGTITPTSVNGLTLASQTTGFTIAGGTTSKTLTISNTLSLAGTDTSTLNIGTGGTLGTAAYTASSAYATSAQGALATAALPSASYTAADVLAKLITVDGTGTNVDADLLDGQHGSYYAPNTHVSDATLHLTSGQNTWIDAITVTAAEVNYSSGVTSSIQTQLGGKQASLGFTPENSANKNATNGYAGLVGGKIDAAQLPAIAITDTFVVGTQAAMLALTCEVGDVAVRTDLSKSFILKTTDPTVLANWQELLAPAGGVSSVNTMTGAVTITNIAGNAGTVTGLTVASTKTLTVNNSLTLAGTDASTLTIGTGGTLGTAAYTASSAYATSAQGTLATNALPAASYTAADVLAKLLTVDGASSGLDADLLDGVAGSSYALLASPALTGTPTAPTATAGTNTTQIATTAFVLANSSGGGATVTDSTTNATYYPACATVTTGSMTSAIVSSTKLKFNPSTGDFTSVNFVTTSDERLKENICQIINPMDIINQLNGKSFNMKDSGKKSYGFIAKELEKILTELFSTDEEAMKAVNYQATIGILLEAVKELNITVQDLKNKIENK